MADERVDEAVLQKLRFGGFSDENLNDMVRAVSELSDAGARPLRVFPKGLLATDGVVVEVSVAMDDLADVMHKASLEERIHQTTSWGIGVVAVDQVVAQMELR